MVLATQSFVAMTCKKKEARGDMPALSYLKKRHGRRLLRYLVGGHVGMSTFSTTQLIKSYYYLKKKFTKPI